MQDEEITPIKYDFVTTFERDIAFVKLNDKWGLINARGEEITPIKHDFATIFNIRFSITTDT